MKDISLLLLLVELLEHKLQFTREQTLGVFRFEVSGINNGSFTHTNSDGSTLTVTVSTPSTSSPQVIQIHL